MMWTDKAFEIWMGDTGRAQAVVSDEAGNDVLAFERTRGVRDECADVMVAPKAGVLARTIATLADRAQLPRIARG